MDNFFKRSQKDSSEHQNGERAAKSKKNVAKRKYHEEYLEYGFIQCANDLSLPFCLNCNMALSNESMNPSKLKRHLNSNHPGLKDKPKSYFASIRSNLEQQ